MSGPYDDIIEMPHHISKKHPRMSQADRAAQFSPFAALTGYDDAISETGRLTDGRVDLDDNEKALLALKLQAAFDDPEDPPLISITHFVKDPRKQGGSYITTHGKAKKYDNVGRAVVMQDSTKIYVDDILSIEIENYPINEC